MSFFWVVGHLMQFWVIFQELSQIRSNTDLWSIHLYNEWFCWVWVSQKQSRGEGTFEVGKHLLGCIGSINSFGCLFWKRSQGTASMLNPHMNQWEKLANPRNCWSSCTMAMWWVQRPSCHPWRLHWIWGCIPRRQHWSQETHISPLFHIEGSATGEAGRLWHS